MGMSSQLGTFWPILFFDNFLEQIGKIDLQVKFPISNFTPAKKMLHKRWLWWLRHLEGPLLYLIQVRCKIQGIRPIICMKQDMTKIPVSEILNQASSLDPVHSGVSLSDALPGGRKNLMDLQSRYYIRHFWPGQISVVETFSCWQHKRNSNTIWKWSSFSS